MIQFIRLLRLLWKHPLQVVLSAILAAGIGIAFGFARPLSYSSSGQVMIPTSDVVARGSSVKPETSVLSIKLNQYIENQLQDDVNKKLETRAGELQSLLASKERNPLFYTLTATAKNAAVAQSAVEISATALIEKFHALSKEQVDQLTAEVTKRLEPLRQQESPLKASEIAKQAELDLLQAQIRNLEGSLAAARETVLRAQITGNFASATTAGKVVTTLQDQINGVAAQVPPRQTELGQIRTQLGQIDAQRQGLEELIRQANDVYLTSFVTAVVSIPPSSPSTGMKLRMAQILGLEVVVAVVVACAVIVRLDRTQVAAMLRRRSPTGTDTVALHDVGTDGGGPSNWSGA
ncbi:MAG: Wzz/FepE/Etk N-terminal domain-containing protein [Egibacteraceae bacterium]